MYSSAFSIYMITSNIFSLLSTLVINKMVDVKMAKKETAKELKRYENHASDRIEKAKKAGKTSAQETKNKK
jgi:membrane protein insertase Oxa1/YidC/SpoIIIJ